MFLGLTPAVAVVTNIEYDHPDVFPTLDSLVQTFRRFIERLPAEGLLAACADDPAAASLAQERLTQGLPVLTYGLNTPSASWSASNLRANAGGGTDFVVRQSGDAIGDCTLPLVGRHNVLNALAAIGVAYHLGVPFATVTAALSRFAGTGRRSEIMGCAAGVTVVSDYAHHPTAIRVTLEAWASHPETRRLWAVWQPHTYNRLRALAQDFARSFEAADQVLVTDVYSVRETITPGFAPPDLVRLIHATGQTYARYSGDLEQTAALLEKEVRAGDSVVILSAGDAPRIGHLLLKALTRNSEET
jgi:UDP-N-acetylmuramate--alanine ligase